MFGIDLRRVGHTSSERGRAKISNTPWPMRFRKRSRLAVDDPWTVVEEAKAQRGSLIARWLRCTIDRHRSSHQAREKRSAPSPHSHDYTGIVVILPEVP